jgi:Ca2+-binding RTX toxin-like protein
MHGGRGNDTIDGQIGRDVMFGDGGDDLLNGGGGNDFLSAGRGVDVLNGGEGNDVLRAAAPGDVHPGGDQVGDTVDGGPGNDRINTRDGEVDRITCGPGFDRAVLDERDVITDSSASAPKGSCERVVRRPAR